MNRDFLTSAFRRVRLRILSGRGDAGGDSEDALQEAFCRLWTRREEISGPSEAEGLLATAVRNIRIDSGRRRQAHPQVGLDDPGYHDSSTEPETDDRAELLRDVERLVAGALSARDREILYRRERDGWEFDELAEHYGLSEGNVRMIVSRARKRIRELYRSGGATAGV